jgi:CelD/BcsL family acetyltransferase involved in cellulose biosynthesis
MVIEPLDTLDDLIRLRAAWQSLWAEDPCATPFQSPGWLLPWVERFAKGRLFSLAAFRDGRLVGLAPLEIVGDRAALLGRGVSDYWRLPGGARPRRRGRRGGARGAAPRGVRRVRAGSGSAQHSIGPASPRSPTRRARPTCAPTWRCRARWRSCARRCPTASARASSAACAGSSARGAPASRPPRPTRSTTS